MMKLKHLFNNVDLAHMCVKQWAYDEDSLKLFEYYRISSNAIYPFKNKGQLLYLRFSPKEEKTLGHIQSEVQLIETLNRANVPVPKIIPSKNNIQVETLTTPWGVYYATVFEGIVSANGITLEGIDIDDNIIFKLGAQLALIHSTLGEMNQEICNRNSFEDILLASKTYFKSIESTLPYLKIAETILNEISAIPKTKTNYGLLHYDYELDNLILNKQDNLIYTIDFDDACYGWYDIDIMIAIENIIEESAYEDYDYVEQLFLKGYQSNRKYNPLTKTQQLTLRKFRNIHKYAKLMQSIDEKWQNEPDWMINIRSKLEHVLTNLAKELLD